MSAHQTYTALRRDFDETAEDRIEKWFARLMVLAAVAANDIAVFIHQQRRTLVLIVVHVYIPRTESRIERPVAPRKMTCLTIRCSCVETLGHIAIRHA